MVAGVRGGLHVDHWDTASTGAPATSVNDFYRRFCGRMNPSEPTCVSSQLSTVLLTVISAIVTFYMDSIAGAWQLLIGIGAGTARS